MKRTSILMLLVATTAVVVAFGVGASVASAATFCQGGACGPSGTQHVTPTNTLNNDTSCPEGTTKVTFASLTNDAGKTLTVGPVTIVISADGSTLDFTISGGNTASVAKLHGGNGQGGVNSTNIYTYLVPASNDTTLHFPGPLSNATFCLTGVVAAVTTSSFNAAYHGRSVTVRWRTSSEVNVLGFNVYRVSHGQRVKLNKRLIPSANVLHGKSTSAYSFRARLASKRLAASSRYLLQEVHTNGSRSNYGPIRARNAA